MRGKMTGDWARLASHVVNRRVALGYRKRDALAEASGLSVQTIGVLENGNRVATATLAAVENALNWAPGSAKSILQGGEPTEVDASGTQRGDPDAPDLRDEAEREIWALRYLSDQKKRAHIAYYRSMLEMERQQHQRTAL